MRQSCAGARVDTTVECLAVVRLVGQAHAAAAAPRALVMLF